MARTGWKMAIAIVILTFLVIFVMQNHEAAKIRFLFLSFETSMAIVVLSAFLIGVLAGFIFFFLRSNYGKG